MLWIKNLLVLLVVKKNTKQNTLGEICIKAHYLKGFLS